MSIRSKIKIEESFEDLFSLKKQQTNFKSIQKIELLELLKHNPEVSRELSAKKINISARTKSRWLNSYVENGIETYIQANKFKEISYNH